MTTRGFAIVVLHVFSVISLVPAYLLLSPQAQWDKPLLLGVLFALATITVFHDVPMGRNMHFDATTSLALIASALVGPLPALSVILPPIAVNALCGRERLIRIGNFVNIAAYGWYTLVGGVLIQALAPELTATSAVGVLVVVGLVQIVVNWLIGPVMHGGLWLGIPFRTLVAMFRDGLPANALMAALGAVTVAAFGTFGLLALGLFAVVAVLPQSALTYAARSRSVAALDPLTAARRYASAMAVHLRLDRVARHELDAVIRLAHARDVDGDPGEHLSHTVVDWSEVSCAAGHVTEWWNGAGGPAGVPGSIIPLSARIAAVARTWAALTADGSPRLGHEEALAHLEAAAGVRLDPRVVHAARTVVAQERHSAAVPAPEPRLHHLRVPARLRRVLAAAA
jgi:hypothetical protein